MTNTFTAVNIIYKVLNVLDITNEISGEVTKKRKINSKLEDIEIGSLPITGDGIQKAVINVNIHVPNLQLKFDGIQDNSQPDYARLEELTVLVTDKLDEQYHDDYWFTVQQQTLFSDNDEHYSNLRIEFFQENIKN